MKPHVQRQRGVALVITLIMLAVVTLMAITFLAVSRRERASVTVTEEQTTARLMAEAANARARADLLARMQSEGTFLAYDLAVSTNFINPAGFDPSLPPDQPNLTNVNYDYRRDGSPLSKDHLYRTIANLQLDPRAPVFVETNRSPAGIQNDFRFYLDINRNGRFETNGLVFWLNTNGVPVTIGSSYLMAFVAGDPEWIGVLQYPNQPHSATNRFVGRYAYLVLPAGKTLDWNFIHNNAALGTSDAPLQRIGFYRNQGVGSWELNLGGFLHNLNRNYWPGYAYNGPGAVTATDSFADALAFLRHRYNTNYALLAGAQAWFFNTNGASRAALLETDFIDTYADGPAPVGLAAPIIDNDDPLQPWAGSENPGGFFELGDLFNPNKVPPHWTNSLNLAQSRLSTYDRYTFYRLLAQIGTDSVPATNWSRANLTNRSRLHLNYDNLPPYNATNMVAWDPQRFFHLAADRLIDATRVRTRNGAFLGEHLVTTNLSATNILIYPYNEYSPVLHRLLQLAVNLYDATTNRTVTTYPHLPTVLRPTFRVVRTPTVTNVFIKGYVEVTNAAFLASMTLRDLNNPRDRDALETDLNPVVYNIPLLIGAKKGFPNFNEISLINVAQVTRKLQATKASPADRLPNQTNLMYMLSVSNRFGVESWNSYTQDFKRPLRLQVAGSMSLVLSNNSPRALLRTLPPPNYTLPYFTNFTLTSWPAREFRLPFVTNVTLVSNEVYLPWPQPAFVTLPPGQSNINFVRTPNLGFYLPQWELQMTNRFYYALVDTLANRLVDFVCIGGIVSKIDLGRQFAGESPTTLALGAVTEPANVWLTNRVDGSTNVSIPTQGVVNQMQISLGNVSTTEDQWRSWNADAASGRDKEKSIDLFRQFCGLDPLVYTSPQDRRTLDNELVGKMAYQAPYSPTRKIYQELSFQANDPLVHYTLGDLVDPYNPPSDPYRTNSFLPVVPPRVVVTNLNLGLLNESYRPWGGNPQKSSDPLDRDVRVKDPKITQSDDWEFPTNRFASIGLIGRVHRGTPWQTVYLKADIADTNLNSLTSWSRWAGSIGTHPTNDWTLVDLFTTAPNDNAARGLLSVNQTNLAAWAAVLSGISILTQTNAAGALHETYLDNSFPQENIRTIVEGINRTRLFEAFRGTGPYFDCLGRVLATPELTFATLPLQVSTNGPLPRALAYWPRDEVLERIPQQILSLLKSDEPRFVIYAFGQTLKEAPRSLLLETGPLNRLCTNYQVKGEFVTKSVIHFEDLLTRPRAVVDSYNELLAE